LGLGVRHSNYDSISDNGDKDTRVPENNIRFADIAADRRY
jgi:hypothetical protein